MSTQLVLVHSPLLGPGSWASVGDLMAALGWDVAVPELRDNGRAPYWPQHVRSVISALRNGTSDVVLVAHSGAGPLLAAIAHQLGTRASALLFVDAGLPGDGLSRLQMLRAEVGDAFADSFQTHLEAGGRYPEWRDRDLAPFIDARAMRATILASQRPRSLNFWTEAIAAPAGWAALPCGYLQLSDGYAMPAARAREMGWPVIERTTNHFALVTDGGTVADDLQTLLGGFGFTPIS
ncbi:MAG: alpha/beta fold hydrolase [Anaerolineaceae bacterium]